jgi:DNA-directed RNA polymerase subunit beta
VDRENQKCGSSDSRPALYQPYSYYQTAWEAENYTIAQANVELDERDEMIRERVDARKSGNFVLVPREDVEYIDVSPKQLVSVAASLIPFLEHDDANRALMGSNMQRQAVPLLRAEAPYVGTGMEYLTAKDSGAVVICKRSGVVDSVERARTAAPRRGTRVSTSTL